MSLEKYMILGNTGVVACEEDEEGGGGQLVI